MSNGQPLTFFVRRLERRETGWRTCAGVYDVCFFPVDVVNADGVGGFVTILHHPTLPLQIGARPTIEAAVANAEDVVRRYHSALAEIIGEAK